MNNTRQTHPENSTNNQPTTVSTTTTVAAPAVNWNELPMETTVPIPSISASIKDEHELSVRTHDDVDEERY